jgi:predicted nucleic acid-binding protein
MTVYLDTSVVLRVLFREGKRISIWGKWDRAYSSTIWRTEAFRTVDRLRLSGYLSDSDVADLAAELEVVNDTLALLPVTETIIRKASESFPTVVGTLDAMHLSSALMLRESEKIDLLLTHDKQLAVAARALGFQVMGSE